VLELRWMKSSVGIKDLGTCMGSSMQNVFHHTKACLVMGWYKIHLEKELLNLLTITLVNAYIHYFLYAENRNTQKITCITIPTSQSISKEITSAKALLFSALAACPWPFSFPSFL